MRLTNEVEAIAHECDEWPTLSDGWLTQARFWLEWGCSHVTDLVLGGLAHPLRHPAEAAPPFAVFEGWELGISGAKLLQKDRLIRVQGTRDHLFDLGSMDETCANSCQASCAPRFWLSC